MSKQHEAVKDMSTGEIVDILLHGGEPLYYKEKQVVLTNVCSQIIKREDRFLFDIMSLATAVREEKITRLVDAPWTEQLDGTWGKGVWCMVWSEGEGVRFEKVYEIDPYDGYETIYAYYDNAEPLDEDTAAKLEALNKGVTK